MTDQARGAAGECARKPTATCMVEWRIEAVLARHAGESRVQSKYRDRCGWQAYVRRTTLIDAAVVAAVVVWSPLSPRIKLRSRACGQGQTDSEPQYPFDV